VETMARVIPDPEIWVLMVADRWLLAIGGREREDEERGRGDEGEIIWGMKNVQKKKKKN
jgi:hypothetical protein